MKRQPIVIRSRPAKAIAIEAETLHVNPWLALLHAFLAFAVPALLAALLTGCIPREDGQTVDYGPQVDPAAINAAIEKPIAGMDPVNIKVGEFRALESSQEIIGIQGAQLISAQGVTITAGSESSDKIIFTAVITDLKYKNDGTYDKVSREGPVCVSKIQGACGEASVPTPGSSAAKAFSSPVAYIENTVKALSTNITFHRLKVVDAVEPVPPLVAQRSNCGGVTGCKMNVTNIGFDQVQWVDGKGTKVHVDVKMSASVPYLSNQLEACFTGLAPVGTTSAVLVKQCSSVYDFRFDAN